MSDKKQGWWYEALRDGNRASTTKLQTLVAALVGTLVVLWCTWKMTIPTGLPDLLLAYMGVVILGRGISKATDVWQTKKEEKDVGSTS
jgi:hypothetical protein